MFHRYSHEDQHGIFGGARQISVGRDQKSDSSLESSGNRHLETAHYRLRFLRDNLGHSFVRLPRQHPRRILKRGIAWRLCVCVIIDERREANFSRGIKLYWRIFELTFFHLSHFPCVYKLTRKKMWLNT